LSLALGRTCTVRLGFELCGFTVGFFLCLPGFAGVKFGGFTGKALLLFCLFADPLLFLEGLAAGFLFETALFLLEGGNQAADAIGFSGKGGAKFIGQGFNGLAQGDDGIFGPLAAGLDLAREGGDFLQDDTGTLGGVGCFNDGAFLGNRQELVPALLGGVGSG
jgi:hypothetical protein